MKLYFYISILVLILALIPYKMDRKPFSKWTCSLFNHDCLELEDVILSNDSTYDHRFENVVNRFKQNFVEGLEVGAQMTVFYKGKNVINIASGEMDSNNNKKYNLQTNQLVFSISKIVSNLVISMLVDRNLIKFEDLISKYWPEFSKFNKEKITIAELLHHKSGLIYPKRKLKLSELQNYDDLAKVLVDEVEHIFDGEPKTAYSSILGGFYINELVRRVDPKKRTIDVFVNEEINKPLNINLNFLVSEEFFNDNVAKMYVYPIIPSLWHLINGYLIHPIKNYLGIKTEVNHIKDLLNKESLGAKAAFLYEKEYLIDLINEYESHSFLCPSAGMKSNAYSIAKLGALISNYGEFDGVRLISKETLEKSSKVIDYEHDTLLKIRVNRTLNGWGYYSINDDFKVITEINEVFGWTGFGGSMLNWSYDKNLSFSYAMNAMSPPGILFDERAIILLNEIYKVVNKIENDN